MFKQFLHSLLGWLSHNFILKAVYRRLAWAPKVYHSTLAFLGAVTYRFPSRKLFVLGVTGTKGKSSTLELINAILEAAGKKTALFSSVRLKVGDKSMMNTSGNTMLGRLYLQEFFSHAVKAGVEYALVEVTSQGVMLNRHRFINWDAAMFLNLHKEHIEAHGSYEAYRQAKVSFFEYVALHSRKRAKFFFVNRDSRDMQYFVNPIGNQGTIIVFGTEDTEKYIHDNLLLEFNKENVAAAVAFARSQGIEEKIIEQALKAFQGVAGRMEFLQLQPFTVVIDYAHTPDSLEKVYRFLKARLAPGKKLIAVLGAAGGGRDSWKRPAMGEIASRYCDRIILTNEDPFDEDPQKIIQEIKKGITAEKQKQVEQYLDRTQAIETAIRHASAGDIVVCTGKGSESYIRVARGERLPWNEKEIVMNMLRG